MVDFDLEENHIWVWSWPWLFIYLLAHFPWDLATLLSFHLMLYIRTFLRLFSGNLSPTFLPFIIVYALQCAHVYFGLRWSCLTWLHSWRGTSLHTSLATCSHTCRVTGSHCCLGTWWVNLVYPLHLNFKLLDAFFKYSVNQDNPENQDNRYNWDNRDNRDNQDNQVRLAHLWVDFRVIFNVRSMMWFVLGIKRIFDIWEKEGGLQSVKLWRNHFLAVLVEKLSNLADLCNNYRGALLSWDLGALLFLHLQR